MSFSIVSSGWSDSIALGFATNPTWDYSLTGSRMKMFQRICLTGILVRCKAPAWLEEVLDYSWCELAEGIYRRGSAEDRREHMEIAGKQSMLDKG